MAEDNNKERDWLEGDAQEAQEKQKELAIELAQIYLVFTDTPRAKQVLEFWEATLVNKQTPTDSSLQVYAADEAVRDFVRGIRRQIKMAQEFRR